MTDLWRFTSERPPSVFGATRIYTFVAHGSLAATRTLTDGGGDACGYPGRNQPSMGVLRVTMASPEPRRERRTEFRKSGFAKILPMSPKSHFQRKPFENRYRKKMTDLWRFTSERPLSVLGGTRIYTFVSHGSVAASQTLTDGGDDVCGYPHGLHPSLGVLRVATASPGPRRQRKTKFR